jgi:hypothetical protein
MFKLHFLEEKASGFSLPIHKVCDKKHKMALANSLLAIIFFGGKFVCW